jgi:hypothetical protein
MTASIGKASPAAARLGLLSEHAYSLLHVRLVRCRAVKGGHARLLQLRNPWGRLEWKGDWSDGSPLWTETLRSQLDPQSCKGVGRQRDDGGAAASPRVGNKGW